MAENAFNEGVKYTIEGLSTIDLSDDIMIKEIPYLAVKRNAKAMADLVVQVRAKSPEVTFTTMTDAQMADLITNAMSAAVEGSLDVLEEITSEATGIKVEELHKLPGSVFPKLALAAMTEQREVMQSFFVLFGGIKGIFEKNAPSKPQATGKPS